MNMGVASLIREPTTYWVSGGPLLVPIAVVSIGIWYYLFRNRRELVAAVNESADVESRTRHLAPGLSFSAIEDTLRDLSGSVARALQTAVRRISGGIDASAAFEQEASALMRPMQRDAVVLAALTAVAPLLGLLGTVMGMIQTFDAVSTTGGGATAGVAGGISRALITTQFGLLVALPGVFGIVRLRRLAGHVEARFGECRAHLLLALRYTEGLAKESAA